ncbi:hypothetical protein [Micromonospora rubida]|uniref:hypothetical protein n=1 Tax=Micromonospora rubida TaxID=2697657 RepID=UPI001378E863|nr:hypothetical protein [Micromonospora rubida]
MTGLVLSAALGAVGCEATSAPPRPVPVPRLGQSPGGAAELVLPLDGYELTPAENLTVHQANIRLLRDCMADFGLTFPESAGRPSRYPRHATLLYWLGAQDVQKYGYGGPPGFAEEMAAAARREARPIAVPESQLPVFSGTSSRVSGRAVPSEGCDGQARRRLHERAPSVDFSTVDPTVVPERGIQALESRAADQARTDDRYRSVIASWSGCMQRSGHRYADPDQAQGDPRWASRPDGASAAPSAPEVAVALADRGCRDEVNLSGVLRSVIAEREEQLIQRHRTVVQQVSTLLRTNLHNAARILDEPTVG